MSADSAASSNRNEKDLTRRGFLRLGLAVPPILALAVAGGRMLEVDRAPAMAQELSLTPNCGDGAATQEQTEGPYFSRNSPERASLLEDGMAGTRLSLSGAVFSRQCQPIEGALLDFWQADDSGNYDNRGYSLRGHQFTDASGRFQLETIIPGLYPGRTRHIHVKVQAPGGRILTTQLYFPDEPGNARDGIFSPALLMVMADGVEGKTAGFNFVVATA